MHILAHLEALIPGRSVETNLLECINDWSNFLDSKSFCDAIYVEFSKAFYKVNHAKLLFKIKTPKFINVHA